MAKKKRKCAWENCRGKVVGLVQTIGSRLPACKRHRDYYRRAEVEFEMICALND